MSMNEKEMNAWVERYEAFYKAHPECPQSEAIESMNLIMKRTYAEAIKSGKKTVEFRAYSPHYCDRLYDKKVDRYIEMHKNEEETQKMLEEGIITPMRIVRNIHFHNYNNSWHLDCECIQNGVIALCKEDVQMLQEQFGCHELDKDLAAFEARGEKDRPLLFYFAIGQIGDNNL